MTGDKVVLQPLKQNLTVEYPAPKEIELWWCGEKDLYLHQHEDRRIDRITNMINLPEANQVDWARVPEEERELIIQLWRVWTGYGYSWCLNQVRSRLATYAKNCSPQEAKSKSLIERAKERLARINK